MPLLVVGDLDLAATCMVSEMASSIESGHVVGVHVDLAGHVSGGAANGLDERAGKRKPSLSASRMDTREIRNRSKPSRSRLMTSIVERTQAQLAAARSRRSVSTSEQFDFDAAPARCGQFLGHLLVRVVTRTRSSRLTRRRTR